MVALPRGARFALSVVVACVVCSIQFADCDDVRSMSGLEWRSVADWMQRVALSGGLLLRVWQSGAWGKCCLAICFAINFGCTYEALAPKPPPARPPLLLPARLPANRRAPAAALVLDHRSRRLVAAPAA
jgi:hypothetical protein